MVIEPKVRGFICTTAHPDGCYESVSQQIEYVRSKGPIEGCTRALIIGASTGYGLASRIVSTFACDAKTIGVFFERPASDKRTATAGWYNTAAFEDIAHKENYYAKSINGDAFSDEIKQRTIELIKQDLGQIDLVVYSLASPRRTDPRSGETFQSVLKPVGQAYTNKTVDPLQGEVKQITIEPATEEDIANTVAVMGGEDWARWIDMMLEENVLADGVKTIAYNYIGPELTHPIYKNGTIGRAKDHLQKTAEELNEKLRDVSGSALISVNKALVTQASSAIPVVPLYISILFEIMKEKVIHEGCIEQIYRLFRDFVYNPEGMQVDTEGRIRIDDLEMREDVQKAVEEIWPKVTTDNLHALTDVDGYLADFYKLFGFRFDAIDYQADVDPVVKIPSIHDEG